MANITSSVGVYAEPLLGNSGRGNIRRIYAIAPATTDTGDTFDIILSKYGSGNFMGIIGFKHSTTNSVVVDMVPAPTTSVTAGVLTVTVGDSTNEKSVYKILVSDGS
jgi:hypothetical protein